MPNQGISRRQLFSLGAVIALAPALRLFPSQAAGTAGRACWLAPLFALPLLALWAWGLSRFLEERREGEQLPDLLLRLGGKPALALFAVWTLVYAGFVLRSGSDRLVGTVYPGASPAVFTQLMGLIALAAALSTPLALARMGRMLLPLLMGALLAVLGVSFLSVDSGNLWPLSPGDLRGAAMAALLPLDILAGTGTALCFLSGGLRGDRPLFPALLRWAGALCVLLSLLSAAVTGVFGAPLAAQLSRPFFVLVRTLVFFRTVERVEALVVMLWIFPDYLLVALFLWAGQYSVRLLFGYRPDTARHAGFDFSAGRWLIWLCGAAAILFALLLAPDPDSLGYWSDVLIPALNLCFLFFFLPLIYIVGKRRAARGG